MIIDVLGWPLNEVIDEFDFKKILYTVTVTKPAKNKFKLKENSLYVIRQKVNNNIYDLVAAMKMDKET